MLCLSLTGDFIGPSLCYLLTKFVYASTPSIPKFQVLGDDSWDKNGRVVTARSHLAVKQYWILVFITDAGTLLNEHFPSHPTHSFFFYFILLCYHSHSKSQLQPLMMQILPICLQSEKTNYFRLFNQDKEMRTRTFEGNQKPAKSRSQMRYGLNNACLLTLIEQKWTF